MYCQSRPFQPLGWKHQWEEKTPWATAKRGTKRALLICHSYWAGNEVVLVLQRLQGLPAWVPLVISHQGNWMKTSRAAGFAAPFLKGAAVSGESFLTFYSPEIKRVFQMRQQICDLSPISSVLGAQLPFLGNENPQLMEAELLFPSLLQPYHTQDFNPTHHLRNITTKDQSTHPLRNITIRDLSTRFEIRLVRDIITDYVIMEMRK